MYRRRLTWSLGALLLAAGSLASAQNAYTTHPMNLRAGPDREYPMVAQLDAGAPLDVHGCLDDWSWCDVSFEDNRGWLYAGGISFVYQGGRVPLYSYGPRLGLPVITFSLNTYWGSYYRGRPWYAQRNTWAHRQMPPHMRPAGRPGMGAAPRPHAGPAPRSRPMPNEHRSGEAHAAPHNPESGRSTPPGRGAQRPMQGGHAPSGEHASPGGGHAPPSGHGPQGGHTGSSSQHGGHGDEHGDHRPP